MLPRGISETLIMPILALRTPSTRLPHSRISAREVMLWYEEPAADYAARVAGMAEQSLRFEIDTWPKPGLVSHVDACSHRDMDASLMYRSAGSLRPFSAELVEAGARGERMTALRAVGLRAERAMLDATGGVNTHRGAIFGLGLLCAAAGFRARACIGLKPRLGVLVSRRWGREILGGPRLSDSHGKSANRHFGAGGAPWEAARGFPSVYRVGLPALRQAGRLVPENAEAARVQACFALIAAVEDTNILFRGGPEGLRFAQCAAQSFLDRGGVARDDWQEHAAAAHLAFVKRDLSPGGAADLLPMSLFVMQLEPVSGQ
jgi:triphosphoribosyl-dephospho-CoA synthase